MATKDGFPPDDRYPVFLSEQAEETVQPDIGKAMGRAALSSRILKASILGVMATAAIGSAILLVGNPVALVANVTASWVDKPALQPGIDPSTSAIQSIASTQDLPTTTRDAPTRDEIAAAVEPADQSQAEIGPPPTEALFKQFQAWAAEEETRAQVGPVQPVQDAPVQVVQDAPAQAVQDAPAQVRPMKKHRQVRSVQNARAEIRPERNPRAKVRREHNPRAKPRREEQNAQVQAPPVPDARAQDQARAQEQARAQAQSVQNSAFPWLPQSFGWRN
ncbi:hypothetical protein IVB22_00870 [Bradyrhizobium sp. 190]|uniref:hypothetical protein n=1 Tax=Bradyrhizobium sp. 190 TaxID=2782658 RepID=UPI001FF86C86|nr:hypothetical protein [Bradyrhizobium sp. 190]MCK1511144.1 hypothetical protein [Bradyrhizobium sp. 190]